MPALLSLLAICLLCVATARGGEASPTPPARAIWSGLVLATNDARPAQAPTGLRQFADKLRNIFGYNQFELVGESAEKVDGPYERWLTPSKDFCLSVKTHNEPEEHYAMKIVLFQNRRRLAEFETHLNSGSPLFIRGPLYAGGQLVIVLHVMNGAEISAYAARAPIVTAKTPVVATKPSPIANAAVLREKTNATPGANLTGPVERLAPTPAERGGPIPADRTGPLPGQRPGDLDGKFVRP